MNRSESLTSFIPAMMVVQKTMPVLKETKEVHAGSHTYSYAEWEKLVPILLPHLNSNGFVVLQSPRYVPNAVAVETVIFHLSGEWVSGEFGFDMPPNANAQAFGSALSYAKRYGFVTLVMGVVAGEDDDAARASAARDRNNGNGFNREDRARKLAQTEIASCMTNDALEEWWQENKADISDLNRDVVKDIMDWVSARHKVLTGGPAAAPAAPKAPASVPPALPKAPTAPRAPAPIAPTAVVPPASVPKAPVQHAPQQPKAPLTLAKGTAPAAPAGPIDDFAGFGDNFPE